jgi:low temperature requirement protein LtrA
MAGRDPAERGRAATPLELLFDLTFVVAFGVTADETSHLLAEGHPLPALAGFGFAMLCVVWAWVNFSWFSSAFDTDDWFYRITTMVQMTGVIVLALGIPPMFESLEHGTLFDNSIMVAGYIVMRVALVAQWLRAATQDPAHRESALLYAIIVGSSQVGWVLVLLLREAPAAVLVPLLIVTATADIGGPFVAERAHGGTPWHAGHIAERYSLLTIIALGEGVFGTVASVSALVSSAGWTFDAVVLIVAGTGLTFALWWIYFLVPVGAVLTTHRERASTWGYIHFLLFPAITGMGAGLHVAAYVIGGESEVGVTAAVLCTAVPVLAYLLVVYGLYAYLVHEVDWRDAAMALPAAALLALGVVLAMTGVSLAVCLLVLVTAPVAYIVFFVAFGWRHEEAALRRTLGSAAAKV